MNSEDIFFNKGDSKNVRISCFEYGFDSVSTSDHSEFVSFTFSIKNSSSVVVSLPAYKFVSPITPLIENGIVDVFIDGSVLSKGTYTWHLTGIKSNSDVLTLGLGKFFCS